MFDLQLLDTNSPIKFNQQLPFFNWHYPFNFDKTELVDQLLPFHTPERRKARRRAVYIHIPFCDTICNFCPFHRDKYHLESDIHEYLTALLSEIDLKSSFLGRLKVDTIFVGGGTPSLLTPEQIELLGRSIYDKFDLQYLKEFTFEIEVKSVTREKLSAMRDIGVNRISFGAQTFSDKYRAMFSLTATVNQIRDAAELVNSMFSYTNVDLLYGLAGQDREELYADAKGVLDLGTTTIDVYPINNLTAQRSMHRAIAHAGLKYLPATTRVLYRVYLDRFFRDRGYAPISGYSYAVSHYDRNSTVVQKSPKFLYHDLVYGYHDDEIIGYGASAVSQLPGFNLCNIQNRRTYVRHVLQGKALPHDAFGPIFSPERGIVLFPYRGVLDKARVPWDFIPDETWAALQKAEAAGLVIDRGDRYELSKVGWLFYVNLMYYLMPHRAKEWISDKIEKQYTRGRNCGETELSALTELDGEWET